jgi:FkbM family methyltransferase
MNYFLKQAIRESLKRLGVGITSYRRLQELKENSRTRDLVALFMELPKRQKEQLLKALPLSRSQLGQDLFVLSELEFKRDGFFVEFGATDGVHLSNTYLLEKHFGWRGIVAEAAPGWRQDLKKNRSCCVETDCVWSESNQTLTFTQTNNWDFSTIEGFRSSDIHSRLRKNGRRYEVRTISLTDLLEKYNAPSVIDYLSIDTEGSEFEILSHFDFDKHPFRVITCEHNFAPQREKIFELLTGKGYVRRFEEVSNVDDWYVRADAGK